MLSFFILTLSFQKSFPQNSSSVDTAWVRHYTGASNSSNHLTALAVDESGNVYVTGSSGSSTNTDYTTIKYNASGDEQWLVRYNGAANGNDNTTALAIDGDGNIYVTGMSEGIGTDRDYATVKYNASGIEQWVVRNDGPNNTVDKATAIAVDGAGNVYVAGGIDGQYHVVLAGLILPGNFATIKYNASGVEQWIVTYDEAGSEETGATALAVDDSGNVFVSGYSHHYNPTGPDTQSYITIKYNSSGSEQWIARYDGPPNYVGGVSELAVDDGGNVHIAVLGGDGSTYEAYVAIKYNASGAEQWVARYSGFNLPTALAKALTLLHNTTCLT